MPLRVQLLNNRLGSLNLDEVDPGQLDKFEKEIKRSDKNGEVILSFTVNLEFNKAGRSFIQDVYEFEGIDGVIQVNIYKYKPNTYNWELDYSGEVKLDDYNIGETTVSLNIENISFQRKFLNLQDLDIDIESTQSNLGETLSQTPTIELEYHPRTILKKYDASPADENEFSLPGLIFFDAPSCLTALGCDRNRDATVFGQIDTMSATIDELDNTFQKSWGWSELEPTEVYRAFEAGTTDIDISLNLKHRAKSNRQGGDYDIEGCGDNDLGKIEIKAFFEHKDINDNVKTSVQIGSDWDVPACPGFTEFISDFELKTYQDQDVVVEVGDKFFVYYTVRIFGNYQQEELASSFTVDHELGVQSVKESTFIRFDTKTTFPATQSKSVLVYELLDKLCSFITDQDISFRSEYFGRIDTRINYPSDGTGSLIAYTNGRNLRQSDNKQIFASFTDTIQSLKAKFPIEWGFERLENGTDVVRVEHKSFFYNKNSRIAVFSNTSKVKMKARKDLYHSQIEIGYPRIEKINQVNGSDEFNSLRKLNVPITRAKGTLKLVSVYRSSGFEIESQRRLLESTEESRLDDQGFLTAVLRDVSGFKTEQNENYSSITNLFDPDSVYNISLSPRRSLENYKEILASQTIRGNKKVINFSFGSLNYLMSSQRIGEDEIAENDSIDLSGVDPIWINDEYSFTTKMRPEEFDLIENNPYGYIEFNDWNNNKLEGFLLSCKFTVEKREAKFRVLRVFRSESN